ncbi:MAG: hypothetical protein ACTSU5_07065 [Promethearchaeota archaeon]
MTRTRTVALLFTAMLVIWSVPAGVILDSEVGVSLEAYRSPENFDGYRDGQPVPGWFLEIGDATPPDLLENQSRVLLGWGGLYKVLSLDLPARDRDQYFYKEVGPSGQTGSVEFWVEACHCHAFVANATGSRLVVCELLGVSSGFHHVRLEIDLGGGHVTTFLDSGQLGEAVTIPAGFGDVTAFGFKTARDGEGNPGPLSLKLDAVGWTWDSGYWRGQDLGRDIVTVGVPFTRAVQFSPVHRVTYLLLLVVPVFCLSVLAILGAMAAREVLRDKRTTAVELRQ